MKTGIYVRAKDKNGHWDSVEITELDEIQMNSFIDAKQQGGDHGWNWVRQLVKFIAGLPDQIPAYEEPKVPLEKKAKKVQLFRP